MSTPARNRAAFTPEEWREHGLQLATRLIAVVRMGRAYVIGNPVLTGQLEQLLAALAPILSAAGEARLVERDGELSLNDTPLPARTNSARFVEQLAQELRVRSIVGLRFTAGLELAELELFLRHFLSSEIYKGAELERACLAQGVAHALPIVHHAAATAPASEPAEAPGQYVRGLEAWSAVARETRALLASGAPRRVATHHYRRLLMPLVDAALAGDAVTAGLADLDSARPGDWLHGLRVSAVTIAAGRALGLDRRALAGAGVSALLYALHAPLLLEPGALDPRLRALAGLAETTPFDAPVLAALRVAIDAGGEGEIVDALSGLIAAADAYVALASSRPDGTARWSPGEALGLVLGPLAGRFPTAVRVALVRAIGVHPPGQIVELDDGSVARVCAADPAQPERPLIEHLAAPSGTAGAALPSAGVHELPRERSVHRAVPFARAA